MTKQYKGFRISKEENARLERLARANNTTGSSVLGMALIALEQQQEGYVGEVASTVMQLQNKARRSTALEHLGFLIGKQAAEGVLNAVIMIDSYKLLSDDELEAEADRLMFLVDKYGEGSEFAAQHTIAEAEIIRRREAA